MTGLAKRFVSNGTPIWKQGVYEGAFESPMAALIASGNNYQTQALPMEIVLPDGSRLPSTTRALVRGRTRDDDRRVQVGTVSEDYSPIQHSQFAHMLKPVADRHPLVMIGDTGRNKERVFWTFDLGKYNVGGNDKEGVQSYLYISNANDGGTSISMMVTDVRMSCFNMLPSATRRSSFSVTIKHSQQALLTTQQWITYLDRVQDIRNARREQFEKMAQSTLLERQIHEILEAAYPTPTSPTVERYRGMPVEEQALLPDTVRARIHSFEQEIRRTEEYRAAAVDALDRTIGDNAGFMIGSNGMPTAWAVYNAVTEAETWRPARRNTQALESILYGERARTCERAATAVMAAISRN